MAECGVFGTYSFRNVAFNIDGSLVTNFDEGDDCITIEPTSDLGTPKVGADGGSILSITADQSATVTIRLLPNSPMNRFLENKVKRMRSGALTGTTFAIGFTDLSSTETGGCTQAVVMREPTTTRGVNANNLEWAIFCPCWQKGTVQVNSAA